MDPGIVNQFLLTVFQVALAGGVGAVLIIGYATKGIFFVDGERFPEKPEFVSEYHELMWLAEGQRRHLSNAETLRFYQLRRMWPRMYMKQSTAIRLRYSRAGV